MTADGYPIHASEDENPDLFWGLRGAGANFGIATSFRFSLHPVGPVVTQGFCVYTIDRAHEIAALFAELAATAPDEVMATLSFGIVGPEDPWPELGGRPVISVQVVHCGHVNNADRILRPLRDARPLADTIGLKTYLSIQGANDEAMAWGRRFYMKGGFVNAITDEVIEACIEKIATAPGACSIGFWAQEGAVARVPADATAFTGRGAAFWAGVEASGRTRHAMRPSSAGVAERGTL